MLLAESTRLLSLFTFSSEKPNENYDRRILANSRHWFSKCYYAITTTDIINNLDQLRSEEYFTCKYTILPSRAEYAFLISPKVKGVFMLQKRLFREKTYLKNIDHVIVISQIRQYNQIFPSTTSNQCEHDLHVR